MDKNSISSDLNHYLGIFRRWLWLIILVPLLIGAAAYIISKNIEPEYQSITTVLISEAPESRSNDYTDIMMSERLAKTYSQLIVKLPVIEGVISELGLDTSAEELRRLIQVQPVRDTTLIEVRVEDTDPQRAADIANTLVKVFSERNQELQASRYQASKENLSKQLADLEDQIRTATDRLAGMPIEASNQVEREQLQANIAQDRQTHASLLQSYEEIRLAEAQSTSNLIQAEPATPAAQPVRPRTLYNTFFAMIAALAVMIGLVLLIDTLDYTLKNPEDVVRVLNLQVLGVIRRHAAEESGPAALLEPRSMVSESFRSLRTNLQFASVDKPLHSLLITSPTPAEGKSTIATNLGVVMAQAGRKVILVDADLRRPKIHELMKVPNEQGLSNLFVLPAGELNGTIQKTSLEVCSSCHQAACPRIHPNCLAQKRWWKY